MLNVISHFFSENYVVICTAIILFYFACADSKNTVKIKRMFIELILAIFLETISSSVEKYLGGYDHFTNGRVAAAVIMHFARATILLTILFIMVREKNNKQMYSLMVIPISLYTVALTIPKLRNGIFYYSQNNELVEGSFFFVTYAVLAVYLILISVFGIRQARSSRIEGISILIGVGFVAFGILDSMLHILNIDDVIHVSLCMTAIAYYVFFQTRSNNQTVDTLENEHREKSRELFDQIIETLSYTIDAKDRYTRGHSLRVAEYSKQIAHAAGMSDEQCREIYHAGLVHDIGKIAVPGNIINKPGKLTDEEFARIKEHPERGAKILAKMADIPYLVEGAMYHHERYDGKGYPSGIAGNDIPLYARIIAVADAYDAMTSVRSYRDPLSQDKVTEELLKGRGTQFDPKFAKIMLDLVYEDIDFSMREKRDIYESDLGNRIIFDEFRKASSEGWEVNEYPSELSFLAQSNAEATMTDECPTIVLFYSDDCRLSKNPDGTDPKDYREFGGISADGSVWSSEAQLMQFSDTRSNSTDDSKVLKCFKNGFEEDVTLERIGDHVQVTVYLGNYSLKALFVLPEDSYKVYAAITGKNCAVSDIVHSRSSELTKPGDIPIVTSRKSYIEGCPTGDIPNMECKAAFGQFSDGADIDNKLMLMKFHSQSFAFANRFWYAPLFVIYSSDDNKVNGPNYKQFMAIRSDGYAWSEIWNLVYDVKLTQDDSFKSWDEWLVKNKAGADVEVRTHIDKDRNLIFCMNNEGVTIDISAQIPEDFPDKLCVSLSGELCALTDIHFVH